MRHNADMSSRQDNAVNDPAQEASARCDVFVIGGGPADATIGALLAQRGGQVVLAEKDRHPRFRIGESLLPLNVPLFEQLGVKERVERIALSKYAAELNSPQHDAPVTFAFDQTWDKGLPHAYQVRRSELDQILFDNRVAAGVRALQCRFERQARDGLRHFSWFIYRMTSPAIRRLFMAPRNYLRMQDARLSLLAGDPFRGTLIYRSLAAFKGLYYRASLLALRGSIPAWWLRRRMLAKGVADGVA